MASIGRTLFRLTGAVLLGASATSIDNPGLLFAPTTPERSAADKPGAAEGVAPGIEIRIAPGKRAFAIRIDDVASTAGVLRPNDRVDVLVVASGPQQQKPAAKLILEDMRILAIGTIPDRLPDGRSINAVVASIEATPAEGEQLAIAAAQGSLQLLLRGSWMAPDRGVPR